MSYNIKWINKYSNEQGFVGKVMRSKGYFENTFDQKTAKKYRSMKEATKDIDFLNQIGEGDNNNFEIIEGWREEEESSNVIEEENTSQPTLDTCPYCERTMIRYPMGYRCMSCHILIRRTTIADLINKANEMKWKENGKYDTTTYKYRSAYHHQHPFRIHIVF